MKAGRPSGIMTTINVIIALAISLVVLASTSSCNRNKRSSSDISGLELPPLPPPPPKVPSMAGSDTTWDMVDQIPMFPGGRELLVKHISMNIKYPEAAKEKGIQGKVVVKFRITSRGNMNGYEIFKSVSPELDAEALRVVKTITKFEPAMVDGKPVSAWFYLPILFTLK